MRARNLKPGFFKNEVLAECDPLARILFEGLWCMADRMGRLEYRPKRIKAEILPYDNVDVIKLLDQLMTKGFIVVYKYDNEYFLEIPTFTEHQNCHIKEAESTIPAPCENDTCTVAVGPLSSFLLPLTESPLPRVRKKIVSNTPQEHFEDFWKLYPRKKSKGDAEKAWGQMVTSKEIVEAILNKLPKLTKGEDWQKENGQFIPYPATWLRAKGWEDELQIPEKKYYAPPEPPAYFEHESTVDPRVKDIVKDLEDKMKMKKEVSA